MSSHHIVKEDQEPALILVDLLAAQPETIRQLLEWNPTVMVLESALDDVLMWGVKFDILICAHNKAKEYAVQLIDFAPVKILTCQPDEEPVTLAMLFLQAGKYKAVNLIGVDPEKIVTYDQNLDIVTFYSGIRWALIRTGKFEKWMKRNEQLQIRAQGVLQKEGVGDDGFVTEQGMVRIISDCPFWLGERYA